MRHRASAPWAGLILFLAAGIWFLRAQVDPRSEPAPGGPVSLINEEVAPELRVRRPSAAVRPAETVPESVSERPPRLVSLAPSVQILRDEVAHDPHLPAPSYMRFADQLGGRLTIAEQSEPQATRMLDELDECLSDQNQAESLRSLCLASANRLAGKYTGLKDRVSKMFASAGPRLARLALGPHY
jgi:hypothetical protein